MRSFVFGALLATASAYSTLATKPESTPDDVLPPSQDPWYTAPEGFETKAPGAILRLRTAPGNLTSVVANSSAAYNILYRTTDSQYRPTWAVTTLFVPSREWQTGNNELLSYQIPYDSADVDASPSYSLYGGASSDITLGLGQGWYFNVPDYEGPLASFTAGVISGHATLDSVRAVLSTGFGLAPDAKYCMWGYSGGALASEWAAELQVQYAPELNFTAAAIGGLTPNISSVLFSVNGGLEAGLVPAGILGITSQYPDIRQLVVDALNPSGEFNRTTFLAAQNQSLTETIGTFANQDLLKYFNDGIGLLTSAPVQNIIDRDGIMGTHGTPAFPLFVYKAIADEVSPVADTDALVDKYCDVGANIWYQRNTVGSHVSEGSNGVTRSFEWLTANFLGVYDREGCTIEEVTVDQNSPSE